MPETGIYTTHRWSGTFTGLRFFPLDPSPDQICIQDIAHHLSLIARFTGATATAYSVAQHSVLVSELCEAEDASWGLMHDAAEAYYTDLNTPVKHTDELEGYRKLEQRGMDVVCDRYALSRRKPSSVSAADTFAFRIECASLFPEGHPTWKPMPGGMSKITPWPADVAERAFLSRFEELFG